VLYDCFTFFNEVELLEIRLRSLRDVVDRFVICESLHTHSGLPKPLTFPTLAEKYKDYPITHLVFPGDPRAGPWDNEHGQRNHMTRALGECRSDDLILLSDIDELPNPAALGDLGDAEVGALEMDLCYYFINCQFPQKWYHAKLFRHRAIGSRTLTEMRFSEAKLIKNGGTHFSYLGGAERIRTKLLSFAHQEFNSPKFTDTENIERRVGASRDLFDRGADLVVHDLVEAPYYVPRSVLDEPDRYRGLIRTPPMKHFYQSIQGWFTFPAFYRSMVERAPQEGARFVEVGSWKGTSAAYLAVEVVNSGKPIEVTCVDTWNGSEEHAGFDTSRLYDEFIENMKPVKDVVKAVRGASVDVATTFDDGSLDLVFIDAAHDHDSVKADIEAWLPKVKTGGTLAGHDHSHPPVGRAVAELLPAAASAGEDVWCYLKPGRQPFVSCICPTYNRVGGDYQWLIEECVEAFLRQTYPEALRELIILNDHPGQTIVCDAPGVRVINHPQRFPTLGEKYNHAIERARGEVILSWEDDDISLPRRIADSVDRLDEGYDYWNPQGSWFMDGHGALHKTHPQGVNHNASAFTKKAWREVGGYARVSGPQDAMMDSALKAKVRTSPVHLTEPRRWSFIYRFGVSNLHLSAFADTQRVYDEYVRRATVHGRFVLAPKWRRDYAALAASMS
jgi:beta-1,4-mannosyl-glycoprotein beta-1,4-N-acetylglucosaminyltransferase